jgi:CRISPR-associated endonuclease/helicase Cas3
MSTSNKIVKSFPLDDRFLAREESKLRDHLLNVGEIAKNQSQKLSNVIWLTSLLHDLGKATDCWQEYLIRNIDNKKKYLATGERTKKNTQPHAIHGAIALLEKKGYSYLNFMIACLIKSHHTYLKFVNDADHKDPKVKKTLSECFNNTADYMESLPAIPTEETHYPVLKKNSLSSKGLFRNWCLLKYLFAVLVDADRTDAMLSSQNGHNTGLNSTDYYDRSRLLSQLTNVTIFTPNFKFVFPSNINPDPLKNDFMDVVLNATWTNLNTITAPCGLGKTIASLKKACQIVNQEKKSKIIYVAALKTILEQTADVFEQCLPGVEILEHHTDFEVEVSDDDPEMVRRYEHNCQTWDSDLIVTTMVQFVDSLVSPLATKNRKLCNLDNSLIIVDEVQTLPEHLLIYVLLYFEYLANYHNVTFIMMSATQPHFKNIDYLGINKLKFNELLPQHKIDEYYDKRQLCKVVKQLDHNNLTSVISEYSQPKLVVVNTTKTAYELFQEMNRKEPEQWVHLSSRMCPIHRWAVIKKITKLKNSNINIISTQVVEAGLDISRPVVISQLAPLDSLIQRMGRCNRTGIGPDGVFIVVGVDYHLPYTEYRLNITKQMLNTYDIVTEQCKSVSDYFARIYDLNHAGEITQGKELVDKLTRNLGKLFIDSKYKKLPQQGNDYWNFKFCSNPEYHTIPENNRNSVLCVQYPGFPYDRKDLENMNKSNKTEWRSLSKYFATIPKYVTTFTQLDNGLVIWEGDYDMDCGVIF